MKKFLLIIAILLSTVLNIRAQYSLMLKGERNPFDTAVAIHIDTYRLESRKMKLADTLIVNLTFQVGSLEQMNGNISARLALTEYKYALKEEEVRVKEATIQSLLNQLEYKPEKSWWDKNHKPVIFIGGVAVGVGGAVLIMNLIK